jgi:hypothetical protein
MSTESRWSIQADSLPVMHKLASLAQAVALLLERHLRSEAEVNAWKARISAWSEYPGKVAEPQLLGLEELAVARIMPERPERLGGRAYIQDSPMVPVIQMQGDADYGCALLRHFTEINKGFLLLEWDLAIDASDYVQMCAYVASDPEAVWAAPYFLFYPAATLVSPSQVPDWEEATEDGHIPFVPLGCTYLPAWVLRRLLQDGAGESIRYPTPDHHFNRWADGHGVRRRLAYYVRPKHLHFGAHVSMVGRPGDKTDIRPAR